MVEANHVHPAIVEVLHCTRFVVRREVSLFVDYIRGLPVMTQITSLSQPLQPTDHVRLEGHRGSLGEETSATITFQAMD